MATKCAYQLCGCPALPSSAFCGDVCEALAGNLIGKIEIRSSVPLKTPSAGSVRCACGHAACEGDGKEE
jgi:hypothetical protein